MPRAALAVLAVLAIVALAACGDGGGGTSPASLQKLLLPPAQISGFKVERTFTWDNPIDFVADGLFLPEATSTSSAVKRFEDAGFDAAAGESLVVAKGNTFQGPRMMIDVVKLGSDDEARKARDFVHAEDLKQPCFAVCSVSPGPIPVPGIPEAKGAQLVPQKQPPPNAPPPFEAYGVAFTNGPRLFIVNGGGPPRQVKKTKVLATAQALYRQNAKSSAGGAKTGGGY